MKPCKFRALALLVTASALLGAGGAYAATTVVTASIKFLSDVTISALSPQPSFGNVKALTVGTYVLSTAGTVTPSGGGVLEGGSPHAGSTTITASAGNAINIFASGYTNGVTDATVPSAATCNYNGAGEVPCGTAGTPMAIAAPVASATMLVGLTVLTTVTATSGTTDNPSFTLNVVYQ